MPKETVITLPGWNDVVRTPWNDTYETKRGRWLRLQYAAANSPLPYQDTALIQIITALDDVEDFLTVAQYAAWPIFRRFPGPLLRPMQAIGATRDWLNLANAGLGTITTGRMGKQRWLQFLDTYLATQEFIVDPNAAGALWLKPTTPLGFAITAGQVLYQLTGYGLVLGSIMSTLSQTLWAGIELTTQGTPITIVLPPPSDPIGKALRIIQHAPILAAANPLLDATETTAALLAWTGAFNIIAEPALVPPTTYQWESFTYEAARYDRYRDTVVTKTLQTSTPFVDAITANISDWVSNPNDPLVRSVDLPVELPWHPLTQQSVDPTPYRDEWLAARARAADTAHNAYIESLRETWANAEQLHNQMFARIDAANTQAALDYHLRNAIIDYSTWANQVGAIFRNTYGWESRLLAAAIELDIFPRYPRSEWNYCNCAEPFDPPTIYSPSMNPEESIFYWLDRARFLWTHPGSLHHWWKVTPQRSIQWFKQPFRKRDRGSALVAASYEIWGARFYRLPFDAIHFHATANFLDGGPPPQASPWSPTEYAAIRRKTHPDNSWANCSQAPPGPDPRCWMEVFPDGTWIQRCPR